MRASPVPEAEVNPSQRALYDAFVERIGKNYTTFKAIRADGALLGPWSAWLQVPRTGDAIRQYIDAVEAMPGLSKSAAQVATLVTGAHFNAAYELYAHAAVGAQAGLSKAQIASLSVGQLPADLDGEQRIAAEITSALLKGGVLPGPMYERGIAELGRDGLEHLVYVVAQYCVVSITLNAFDVPAEVS